MGKSNFKAGIFDLDGVIVNTVPLHFRAWKKMFSEYGIKFTFEDYKRKVDGIPRYDGARAVLTKLSDKEIKIAGDKKQQYFLELIKQTEIPVYPSSIDLIKRLKKCNKKIAIISSSKNCKRILKKVGINKDLVDAVIDGYDISKGKPDPQIFQMAAKRLDCNCSECVVFEDAVLGVEAAINAGMVCIGIDRYKNPQRLAKAHLVVKDLSEITIKTIKELFKSQSC